jgi:hypothetical protein
MWKNPGAHCIVSWELAYMGRMAAMVQEQKGTIDKHVKKLVDQSWVILFMNIHKPNRVMYDNSK